MSQLERRAPWEERQVERAHSGARGMGAYLPNRLCNFAGFVIALRGPILLVRGVVGGIEVSMLARESVRPLSLAAGTLLRAHSVRDSVAGLCCGAWHADAFSTMGLARRRLLNNGKARLGASEQSAMSWKKNHVGILSGWFLNDIVGEGKCRTQRIMHMLHPRLLGFTGSTFGKYSPERDHTR